MKIFDSEHKKKSAVLTALILALLLVGVFSFGLTYMDPPIEYGVAINFGDSDVGKGEPVDEIKNTPDNSQEEVVEDKIEEENVEEKETTNETEEVIDEEVITEEKEEEAPVAKEKKEKKKVEKETPKKEEKKIEEKKKSKPKPKPKPSKATTDALNSLLNNTNGSNQGEGDDYKDGVKGKEGGDPKSTKYYGNTGGGSDGNYNLAGRKALSKPIQKPDCQEEGTVVVSIEVDNSGKVIKAVPGVKGSTNTSPCLLKPAKQAALKTKWNPDGNAPNKQRGTIVYKFSLSK